MSDDRDNAALSRGGKGEAAAERMAMRTLDGLSRGSDRTAATGTPGVSSPGPRSSHPDQAPGSDPPSPGLWTHADRLSLPELDLRADDATRTAFNLLVVGGTGEQAYALAAELAGRADVRRIAIAITPNDLGAIATAIDANDFLVVDSIEAQPVETIDLLAGLLQLTDGRDPGGERAMHRSLDVLVGTGSTARHLTLEIAPFKIVVRTWTGRLPEPLGPWDARVTLSRETKLCPACAEEIRGAARVCRFCGYELGAPT